MLLIIAYGNSLRNDDGAGIILGEMLAGVCRQRNISVDCLTVHQLMPELALDIAAEPIRGVVFTDTRVVESERDSLKVETRPLNLRDAAVTVGHHLTPETLLAYADILYGSRPPAWVLTVPGVDFGHGEQFSPLTQTALDTTQAVFKALLEQFTLSDYPAQEID